MHSCFHLNSFLGSWTWAWSQPSCGFHLIINIIGTLFTPDHQDYFQNKIHLPFNIMFRIVLQSCTQEMVISVIGFETERYYVGVWGQLCSSIILCFLDPCVWYVSLVHCYVTEKHVAHLIHVTHITSNWERFWRNLKGYLTSSPDIFVEKTSLRLSWLQFSIVWMVFMFTKVH